MPEHEGFMAAWSIVLHLKRIIMPKTMPEICQWWFSWIGWFVPCFTALQTLLWLGRATAEKFEPQRFDTLLLLIRPSGLLQCLSKAIITLIKVRNTRKYFTKLKLGLKPMTFGLVVQSIDHSLLCDDHSATILLDYSTDLHWLYWTWDLYLTTNLTWLEILLD